MPLPDVQNRQLEMRPLVADHLVDARADALVLADQLQADHVAVEGNRPRAIANDESGVVQSSNHSHLPATA